MLAIVRDCSGLLWDCICPNFCRSGIARDYSGFANVPTFAGPGLLGVPPGLQMSQFLQVRDCSGLLRDRKVPIFAGPGLLGIAPGLHMSQFLQVRDCSRLFRVCKRPNFCRSGIAQDCSGIADVPIFAGPGLLEIVLGLQTAQFLQVRDCSGLLRDRKVPIFAGPGLLGIAPGLIADVPIFAGPGLLGIVLGFQTSQFS